MNPATHMAQDYLISRPLPLAALLAFLHDDERHAPPSLTRGICAKTASDQR